jgi:hypothetical protein|tara:strand:+ start:451 stop:582 length:132 start_codon:yes stop_codon:yes gene_type:complete
MCVLKAFVLGEFGLEKALLVRDWFFVFNRAYAIINFINTPFVS